ncbi:hypothetical protein [Vitiosangium sp. GDMCC 1.1324]|uniref:hypothetical protein n=1 Tax=Vitiosangium sp. (strain GDMCC 1.1324) TaxID=2138576 RepID=UPI0011B483DD|nr:hypothetical protein [Vitiosangium sp. GDMCC 1.1324]
MSAPEAPPARPTAFVELPEPPLEPAPPPEQEAPPPGPAPTRAEALEDEEQPPSRLLETDSGSWVRPTSQAGRPSRGDDERIWLSEAAEAARAGNTSISASEPVEAVTIATGTVDGRVKRVRPGTLEVSDDEGNVYELRIDGRSRGLRRGRTVPLQDISEGTPVRASFDLVGGGESLARDIVLRR